MTTDELLHSCRGSKVSISLYDSHFWLPSRSPQRGNLPLEAYVMSNIWSIFCPVFACMWAKMKCLFATWSLRSRNSQMSLPRLRLDIIKKTCNSTLTPLICDFAGANYQNILFL